MDTLPVSFHGSFLLLPWDHGEGSLDLLSCTPQLWVHSLAWSGDSGFPLQSNGVRNVLQSCL